MWEPGEAAVGKERREIVSMVQWYWAQRWNLGDSDFGPASLFCTPNLLYECGSWSLAGT